MNFLISIGIGFILGIILITFAFKNIYIFISPAQYIPYHYQQLKTMTKKNIKEIERLKKTIDLHQDKAKNTVNKVRREAHLKKVNELKEELKELEGDN